MNKKHDLKSIFINSWFMFIVTYCLLQLNSQLLTIFISQDFYLDITWFFSHLNFNPALTAPYVPMDTKISLTMAGPIVSLLAGLGFLFLYLLVKTRLLWVSFLLLWGFIHAFNNFFGVLGMSAFAETPILVASQLFNIGWFTKTIFATAGLYLLFLIGKNTGHALLIKNGDYLTSNRKDRLHFMTAGIFLPMITGSVLLLALDLYDKQLHYLPFVTIILLVLPAFFRFIDQLPVNPEEKNNNYQIHWGIIFLSIIFVALYFYLTKNGIQI
ncbi:MAG: hypothetical protein K9J27_04165 [Bacteroidales bacterium]|nr:hypothetical protein [Bacteroidales bacterium]MCF8334610.1 hypothetical protein [Bacteroidales bacterium]